MQGQARQDQECTDPYAGQYSLPIQPVTQQQGSDGRYQGNQTHLYRFKLPQQVEAPEESQDRTE